MAVKSMRFQSNTKVPDETKTGYVRALAKKIEVPSNKTNKDGDNGHNMPRRFDKRKQTAVCLQKM